MIRQPSSKACGSRRKGPPRFTPNRSPGSRLRSVVQCDRAADLDLLQASGASEFSSIQFGPVLRGWEEPSLAGRLRGCGRRELSTWRCTRDPEQTRELGLMHQAGTTECRDLRRPWRCTRH
jgi:hypothetical protein